MWKAEESKLENILIRSSFSSVVGRLQADTFKINYEAREKKNVLAYDVMGEVMGEEFHK